LGSRRVPAGLRRPGRGAPARLCRDHPRYAPRHDLLLRLPPRAATPSLFIDDIPDRHRVPGWLHQLGAAPVPVRSQAGRLNAAELLQRF
ncbi:MAG TPA: hypothetical protein VHT52_12085, partial [Stellaceae bacterium]|nr:hypothetical protein [Stellaceae bacterium]